MNPSPVSCFIKQYPETGFNSQDWSIPIYRLFSDNKSIIFCYNFEYAVTGFFLWRAFDRRSTSSLVHFNSKLSLDPVILIISRWSGSDSRNLGALLHRTKIIVKLTSERKKSYMAVVAPSISKQNHAKLQGNKGFTHHHTRLIYLPRRRQRHQLYKAGYESPWMTHVWHSWVTR